MKLTYPSIAFLSKPKDKQKFRSDFRSLDMNSLGLQLLHFLD